MGQILIDDCLSLIDQLPEAVGGFVAAIEATKDPATSSWGRAGASASRFYAARRKRSTTAGVQSLFNHQHVRQGPHRRCIASTHSSIRSANPDCAL